MLTRQILLFALCLAFQLTLSGQTTNNLQMPTSINDDGTAPDDAAILDVKSTTKGMLIPRMSSSQRMNIATPPMGLLVFDTNTESFWFHDGTAWNDISARLTDADDDTKVQVEESSDDDHIRFDVDGNEAMVISPTGNIGIGTDAPLQRLDVRGSNADDGATMTLGNSDLSHRLMLFPGRQSGPDPFIGWKDGDPLRFATDENIYTEKMRIAADGKVGIGTDDQSKNWTWTVL